MQCDVILLCAGSGERTKLSYNKVFYLLDGKPLYQHSLKKFLSFKEVNKVLLVVKEEEMDLFKGVDSSRVEIVIGGKTRMESVQNALELVESKIVLIHDGARPYTRIEDIKRVIEDTEIYKTAILGSSSKNTVRLKTEKEEEYKVLPRELIYEIYTPQGFYTEDIKKAYEEAIKNGFTATDDAGVYEEYISPKIHIVEGSDQNKKITTPSDLEGKYRIGHSFDIHALVDNRRFILGGVEIPFKKGLLGHSDADVVLHAITESLIGALALGDIGSWFPDTDMNYKDMDSSFFLKKVLEKVKEMEYSIQNIDIMVYLELPKLRPYIDSIRESVRNLLETSIENVSIKATTLEKFGPIGEGCAIGCEAVVLLKKNVS